MAGKSKWMFEGRSYGKWVNKGIRDGSMFWQFTIFGRVFAGIYRTKVGKGPFEYVVFITSGPVKKFSTLDEAKAYVQDYIGGYR